MAQVRARSTAGANQQSTEVASRSPGRRGVLGWFGAQLRGLAAWLLTKSDPGVVFGDPELGGPKSFLRGAVPYGYPPARGSRELLQVSKRNPWLRAALHKVTSHVASVRWSAYVAYDKNGQPSKDLAAQYRDARRSVLSRPALTAQDHHQRSADLQRLRRDMGVEPLPSHPLLDLLNNPNPVMTGVAARDLTQQHLELVGESFWLLERNPVGMPIRFWVAPNYWVIRTPSPGYPYFDVFYNGIRQQVPERDMMWMRHFDVANPYARGAGAGQSLGDEIETDEYAAKVTKGIFEHNSTPAGIVSIEAGDEDELEEAHDRWDQKFQGPLNAFRVAFLNAKAKFLQLTPNFADQGILDLRKVLRDTYRGVFGVPPELLGIVDDSNRATSQAAQAIMAVNTVVPKLEFLRDQFEHRLVPEFDEAVVLEYESPVPADQDFTLSVMTAQPGCFSKNRWRALAGDPPIDGWDDEFPSDSSSSAEAPPKSAKAPARHQVVEVATGPELPVPLNGTHRNGTHKRP